MYWTSAAIRRDLPIPGSPDSSTNLPAPAFACCQRRCEQFNLTPQRKRETLFDAFIHQLEAIARRGPVLIIFEDAHWIDPTTRELLEIIVDRVSRMSVLLVTSRDSSLLSFCSGVSSRASPAARSSCATNG